ncbi:MAG: NAD(P)H-hydrate epimerase [Phycisphaerales bacterium]
MRVLDNAAARELDRAAQVRYGIPGIVLMENAAIGMATIACEMLGAPTPFASNVEAAPLRGKRVVVVCGPGNNGGDGYAIARHLANRAASVTIVAIGSPRAGSDAAVNAATTALMRVPLGSLDVLRSRPDLVVDALYGSGLDRPLEGPSLDAVRAINASGAAVLAVDVPSGLHGDTGEPLGDAVRATITAVTVAPRPACLVAAASAYLGAWRVVDIGCPARLLDEAVSKS